MKLTPNENILRVALIVFSILFGILSISLIVLGIVYTDELWWPRRYVGLDFLDLPTFLITLGTLSLVMAIAGCFCAKSYNRKLLLTYGFILLVILSLELTIAVIAFINFDEHQVAGHTKTQEIMLKQYNSDKYEDQIDFQQLEDHYKCCGVTGFEFNCTGYNETLGNLDDDNSETSTPIYYDYSNPMKGCASAVDEQIQTIAEEVGYIAVFFSILQIVEIGYVYLIQHPLIGTA